jgi:hypothetical protein
LGENASLNVPSPFFMFLRCARTDLSIKGILPLFSMFDTSLFISFCLFYLGNENVREAVMDFLTVTHIAEASVPTIKALATFKEGIGLVQDYDNQIKNELDIDISSAVRFRTNSF